MFCWLGSLLKHLCSKIVSVIASSECPSTGAGLLRVGTVFRWIHCRSCSLHLACAPMHPSPHAPTNSCVPQPPVVRRLESLAELPLYLAFGGICGVVSASFSFSTRVATGENVDCVQIAVRIVCGLCADCVQACGCSSMVRYGHALSRCAPAAPLPCLCCQPPGSAPCFAPLRHNWVPPCPLCIVCARGELRLGAPLMPCTSHSCLPHVYSPRIVKACPLCRRL